MARNIVAADQNIEGFPEGVPLSQVATIVKVNTHTLTDEEVRAQAI